MCDKEFKELVKSFLIGMGTEQPTMWVSWRNARMVLFIPWRETLAMPVNRISILSAAALSTVTELLEKGERKPEVYFSGSFALHMKWSVHGIACGVGLIFTGYFYII